MSFGTFIKVEVLLAISRWKIVRVSKKYWARRLLEKSMWCSHESNVSSVDVFLSKFCPVQWEVIYLKISHVLLGIELVIRHVVYTLNILKNCNVTQSTDCIREQNLQKYDICSYGNCTEIILVLNISNWPNNGAYGVCLLGGNHRWMPCKWIYTHGQSTKDSILPLPAATTLINTGCCENHK